MYCIIIQSVDFIILIIYLFYLLLFQVKKLFIIDYYWLSFIHYLIYFWLFIDYFIDYLLIILLFLDVKIVLILIFKSKYWF